MKKNSYPHNVIENHPVHYTLLFDWILNSIPDIFEGINSKKIKNKHLNISGIPDLNLWLMLYKKSKHITFCLIEEFFNNYSNNENLLSLICFHLCISQQKQVEIINNVIDEYNSLSDFDKKLYRSKVRKFNRDVLSDSQSIINDDFSSVSQEIARNTLSKIEFIFLIYTIMPCLIFYGELPSSLMRKARLGDFDALGKLLRVDKSCIYDKILSKKLHIISYNNMQNYNNVFKNILKDTPTLSRKKISFKLIGLLSKISKIYGRSLKTSHISSDDLIFRFYEHANNQRLDDIDEIFKRNLDAIYKDISRKEKFWKIFKLPDKK